jgi:plasmid stabilization system protein ParE
VKYKVFVTDEAKADFQAIHDYLTKRFGRQTAARFKLSYKKLLKALTTHPLQYPAIKQREYVRKCSSLAPTIVFYEVIGDTVTITYLMDGRRGDLYNA